MFRILIVDDEPSILGLLKSVLELASFEPQTARSAAEAKLLLSQQTFDMVLTDMRMETTTAGFDVVRAARQLDPKPAIAILTAFPMSPTEWRPSGADALMVKGADIMSLPDKLLSLIKAKLRSQHPPVVMAAQRL
ncbi:MAG TPA: response regulator [Terriglobales bacterium]|nr:response regulator [Terriglobales bacterium]